MTAPDVPERWVEMFGEGWHSVPEGQPGDRRRAGLRLVLDDMRRQVEMKRDRADKHLGSGWLRDEHSAGQAFAYDDVLDLLDTGGHDE